ncbi:30S ribosomal protein S15 [Candidatus Deianiraea vastatrix]|uniref:Small ribosomal subunit protein uS15 n=1 Tax=Candidatus Deianiraea vastatrix TaxID=2163644 RepID=A0A5B8XHN9_9RICK|nr:30S ribosomal protein S15 [Candidatus Deianiraea vastatrix]QED23307.1 30S ribosomal protein S15 [Candidatus Deianiraea vastatrix]
MSSSAEKIYSFEDVVKMFKRHENDSGSSEIQIVMMTYQISYLTRHLREFPMDHDAKRRLIQIVHRRRKLLKYLRNSGEIAQFQKLIDVLNIRYSSKV